MLTGASVDDVCRVMGTRGATRSRDLVRALRHYGLGCADALVPIRQVRDFVPLAVARMTPRGVRHGHWVVWTDGYFVDPADGWCWRPEDLTCVAEANGWRWVSILPVEARA